jgi:hypothetical protein
MQELPRTEEKITLMSENRHEFLFSQETIDAVVELGGVLTVIRKRMLAEGYNIVDGQVKKRV